MPADAETLAQLSPLPQDIATMAQDLEARIAVADDAALYVLALELLEHSLSRAVTLRRRGLQPADDPAMGWLAQRTRQLWFAWGASATSGGEGLARRDAIDDALAALRQACGPPAVADATPRRPPG